MPPPATAAVARVGLLTWFDSAGGQRTGVALMLVSCALLAGGDAISKWLSATLPVGQIICLRGLVILLLLTLIIGPGELSRTRLRSPTRQIVRAGFFVAATFLMIGSFKLLPLPVVSAISFTAPLMMTALAPLVLREHVGWRRWIAVVAGLSGVLIIINPFGEAWTAVLLLPLGAALCGALRDLTTRGAAEKDPATSVVLVAMLGCVIVGGATAVSGWSMPTAFDALLLLLLGLLHGAAYLMQVAAFRTADAGLLAPFKYTLLLWALLAAYLVWGYVPTASMLAGTAIVIATGLYVWHRELRVPRAASVSPTAALNTQAASSRKDDQDYDR